MKPKCQLKLEPQGAPNATLSRKAPGTDFQDLLLRGATIMEKAEDASEALRKILVLLTEHMWFAYSALYSTSAQGRTFRCVGQSKPVISPAITPFSRLGLSPLRQAAKTRKPVYLADCRQDQVHAEGARIKSLYAVPLILRGKVHGVLCIHTYESSAIDAACWDLIDRFALLASLALERIKHDDTSPKENPILESMFEQKHFGVALAALDGTIKTANQALAELLGYLPAGLAGKQLAELVPEDERSMWRKVVEQTSGQNPPRGLPLHRYLRNSGEVVWCSTSLSVVPDAHGKPAALLVLVTDRNAMKQAEEARDRLESELLQAQKIQTLGMLAGGVAHDFNNALEVIMGFASLALLRLSPGDPLHEPLKIIAVSASGAAGLAHELLDAARNDEAHAEPVDVAELVNSVINIITRTFDRKIRVEHLVEAQEPYIRGFRGRFEQAILNLCLNARDAMPAGGTLAVEATTETFAENDPRLPAPCTAGAYVRIAVRDTGVGMSPQVMEHMCKPLFTTKAAGQNAGLGLTMVERIINEAGGFISAASAPSEGTELALYLPAATPEPSRPKTHSNQLVRGRGTVLVVDDEPRVLDFLEKGLTRIGYKVLCAETGRLACEIYSKQFQNIICVLLDMIMPDISGLETYGLLRDINPGVKVILSSGYSSEHVKRQVEEACGADFLGKPYTLETLSQAIKKARHN
ncbi:MAG TPA: response regulator [Terriglobia bacterium]|nr:response regulator [Terriglobia bacterium]